MRPAPQHAIRPALLAAGAGLAGFAGGLLVEPEAAVRGWLVAALFFLGLSLGALTTLMIHQLGGGRWGEAIRPELVAMTGLLPWTLLAMALPLAQIREILPWTTMAGDALPEHVRAKLAYFDPAFLAGRTVVILALWLLVAWAVTATASGSGEARRRSVAGLVVVMVTTMVFATDWMMAPEPEFYSTIYPVLETSGEVVGAFALAIIGLAALGRLDRQPAVARGVLLSEDLANLFFGFILLWVYLAFMQWLIVWAGNLPEEIAWYLRRGSGPWLPLLLALIVLHFIVPLAMLLSRRVKRSPAALAGLAAVVLLGHLADIAWRLGPPMIADGTAAAIGVAAFLAVGGVWLAGVTWMLAGRSSPVRRSGTNV